MCDLITPIAVLGDIYNRVCVFSLLFLRISSGRAELLSQPRLTLAYPLFTLVPDCNTFTCCEDGPTITSAFVHLLTDFTSLSFNPSYCVSVSVWTMTGIVFSDK